MTHTHHIWINKEKNVYFFLLLETFFKHSSGSPPVHPRLSVAHLAPSQRSTGCDSSSLSSGEQGDIRGHYHGNRVAGERLYGARPRQCYIYTLVLWIAALWPVKICIIVSCIYWCIDQRLPKLDASVLLLYRVQSRKIRRRGWSSNIIIICFSGCCFIIFCQNLVAVEHMLACVGNRKVWFGKLRKVWAFLQLCSVFIETIYLVKQVQWNLFLPVFIQSLL